MTRVMACFGTKLAQFWEAIKPLRCCMLVCSYTLLAVSGIVYSASGAGQDYIPPKQVSVLPVFIVPTDEVPPTEDQKGRLQKHLRWTQARYREMLKGRDTFIIATNAPLVIVGKFSGPQYDALPEDAAPQFVSEVLASLHLTRFNVPYSLVIIRMNTRNSNPAGGGRPLNGGYNNGGGMLELSSWGLDKSPNFQSTLQHELGHSFGLPHVNVYGYDLQTNMSIMSYNPKHHTDGFHPSPTPGILIPEDIRGLALNSRVLPNLKFNPLTDVPPGYNLKPVVCLGPQKIPGQPDYEISATTIPGFQ